MNPDPDAAAMLGAAKSPHQDPPGSDAWIPPAPEELSALIPNLVVEALIGRGGMGAVYRAKQVALDRLVALKILQPSLGNQSEFAERFAREAKAMALLHHPGIIAVYDYGKAGDFLWLTMELVVGANLREVLKTGALSPESALRLIPRLCDAIQFAHDSGVVHRDLKPENILIDARGWPRIADFGLAKIATSDAGNLTQSGQILGTYRYMAPEQLAGDSSANHRADIYSLGVVLYEMLTGSLPQGRFEAPSKRAELDVRIDAVVLRSLERQPELRWQQASHLSQAVEAIGSTPAPPEAEPAPGTTSAQSVPLVLPGWWMKLHALRRSRGDREWLGVCGGLGAATPLPSALWRAIFLVLSLCWGIGLVPYVILGLCMPAGIDPPRQTPWYVVFILIGIAVLLFSGIAMSVWG